MTTCPTCGQLDLNGCGCPDNPPWQDDRYRKLTPVPDPDDPNDGRYGYDDDAFEPSDKLTDDQWRRR